jgi:hypothetical protein
VYAYLAGISLAVFENTSTIVARHVPATTHDIVNVLAQARSTRVLSASPEAELGCGHKVLVGSSQQLSSLRDTWCRPSTRATAAIDHY